MYTTVKKLRVNVLMFLKDISCSPRLHLFDKNTVKTVIF